MNRIRRAALAGVCVLATAVALAQGPGAADDERDPLLARWPKFATIARPAGALGKIARGELPFPLLAIAGEDLRDLRLVDAQGNRTPHVVETLRRTDAQAPIRIERRFDAGPRAGEKCFEASYELDLPSGAGHNEIEIRTAGADFRRRVEVLGSHRENFAEGQSILGKNTYVVRYATDGGPVEVRRFPYELKRFGYLKVRVYADVSTGEETPKLEEVVVRRTERSPGRYVEYPITLGSREPVSDGGVASSGFFLTLGPEARHCERITLTARTPPADRTVRLESAPPGHYRQTLGGVAMHWPPREPGQETLVVSFSEIRTTRLRLTVADYANEPFDFTSATGTMAAREIVFEPPAAENAWPLKLYVGHPEAAPANYDLASRLPPRAAGTPVVVASGLEANPAYVAPPPPFHERNPWASTAVLAAACAVLVGLLLPLARQTLATPAERTQ